VFKASTPHPQTQSRDNDEFYTPWTCMSFLANGLIFCIPNGFRAHTFLGFEFLIEKNTGFKFNVIKKPTCHDFEKYVSEENMLTVLLFDLLI